MERRIMGLDMSKKSTGCAIIDMNCKPYYAGFITNEGISDITTIRKRLIKYIKRLVLEHGVTDVVVEDVFGGVNFDTNRLLIILNESAVDVKMQNPEINFDVFKYENTAWKSDLVQSTGKDIRITGRHKEAVQEALEEYYNVEYLRKIDAPSDIYDALGIATNHVLKIKNDIGVIDTETKTEFVRNFRLGLISFYFVDEADLMYIQENLDDGIEVFEVNYDRTIERTVKKFYKQFPKHCVCAIKIDDYKQLGLDLMKYDIRDEVFGKTDFYCIAIVKQVEKKQRVLREYNRKCPT